MSDGKPAVNETRKKVGMRTGGLTVTTVGTKRMVGTMLRCEGTVAMRRVARVARLMRTVARTVVRVARLTAWSTELQRTPATHYIRHLVFW
jgi:hypothetical protein